MNGAEQSKSELAELKRILTDPAAVWANILRGTIAMPEQVKCAEEYHGRLKREAEETVEQWAKCKKQRDQLIHLILGRTITEEEVTQSGLGLWVLHEHQRREERIITAEAENKRLREAMETLAAYANTVRTDRKHSHPDSLSVMCLQTIDWCEGLIEYVREARKVMEALEVKP